MLEYPNLRGKEVRNRINERYEKVVLDNFGDVGYLRNNYSWTDSLVEHYSKTFSRELTYLGGLSGYLNLRFGNRKVNCLDLGGTGNLLFRDIHAEGKNPKVPILNINKKSAVELNKTLGVSLHHGQDEFSEDGWKHKNIVGDVYSDLTFSHVEKYFKKDGVDFIISRMGAGLEFAPENPFKIFQAIKNYYSILNPGGSMLLQGPARHTKLIRVWANYINRNFPNLKVTVKSPTHRGGWDASAYSPDNLTILVEKDQGSPVELPALSKFDIFRMKKD